jgi:hypothetical protein
MGKTWNAKEHNLVDLFPDSFLSKTKLEDVRRQLYTFAVGHTGSKTLVDLV